MVRVVGGGGAVCLACRPIFWPCPRTDLCALMDVSKGRRRGRRGGNASDECSEKINAVKKIYAFSLICKALQHE